MSGFGVREPIGWIGPMDCRLWSIDLLGGGYAAVGTPSNLCPLAVSNDQDRSFFAFVGCCHVPAVGLRLNS